jgi:beta-glucosidase
MAELGLKATGSPPPGRAFCPRVCLVNSPGLDFYDRLVDALLSRNIQPFLTLYHWDLPQALRGFGRLVDPRYGLPLAEYAGIVAQRLGDRVPYWITTTSLW